jgi:hypothetical protein
MSKETLISAVGLLAIGAILVIAFRAYLHPDFAISFGSLLLFCT